LYLDISPFRAEILAALDRFAAVPASQYRAELLLGIFTPQTSPYRAQAAVDTLSAEGFFDGKLSEERIVEILRTPSAYVRFHSTKAKRAILFLDVIDSVLEMLAQGASPQEERAFLVKTVNGYGWKEASHVLRNIGRRDLAILDRHILKHLQKQGVIFEIPKSMTPARYFDIEKRFLDFATQIGEPLDVLDLYFWASETGSVFK
jgi:N-glycosylase/DNA lyase